MSYDIDFFQMRDGMTLDEVNRRVRKRLRKIRIVYIFRHLRAIFRGNDEDDDDGPDILPLECVNAELPIDQLRLMVGKAYLRATIPEANRSQELRRYLDSTEAVKPPDEVYDELLFLFEFAGENGVQRLCFGLGAYLGTTLRNMAAVLEELAPLRIVAYDYQVGQVIDGSNALEALTLTYTRVKKEHNELLAALGAPPDEFMK